MRTEIVRTNPPVGRVVALPDGAIERRIIAMRGHTVMLDADLAKLYRVTTKAFNQAVKRNKDRFPSDFMFQLTPQEAKLLRSQSVTLDGVARSSVQSGRGRYSKYASHAFTEHGIAMLSSVLRSKRAVQMNILIIRAFIRLREMLSNHKDLALRVEKIETAHHCQGTMIGALAWEIQQLKKLPKTKRRFGFQTDEGN
jgi:hypothetical protein